MNLSLSPDEWESLIAIALVAFGSENLDIQDLAFAECLLRKGGAVNDDDDEEENSDNQIH